MFYTFLMVAWKNAMRRIKTVSLLFFCVLVSVFSVVLVWTSYDTIKAGVELSKERMSADVIVYPYETELSDVSMLYSGIAQSVYMDEEIAEQLENQYVEKIVSQFYLQTIPTAGCCTVTKEMRLVGVNWEDDFTVRSYLNGVDIKELGMQDIILGGNVDIEGENTMILNQPVRVVGVLESTGTYLDDSIILPMEQLKRLAKINFPQNYFGEKEPTELITCALVKLKDGVDPQEYMDSIRDVQARKVLVSSTTQTVQSEITVLFRLLTGAAVVILTLCVVALFSQLQSMVHSRYREIGYFRSIGVKKADIYIMFALEIGVVVFAAGVFASVLGLVSSHYTIEWIRQYMSLPITNWTSQFVVVHFLGGVVLAMVVSALSAAFPLGRAAQMSPQEAMTEGEI